MDGHTPLVFDLAISQNLFIVLWHRNHLPVISSYALSAPGGIYTYDFTTTSDQAYNSGQNEIAPGLWGMVAGDADASGLVDDTDKTSVWDLQTGESGYWSSDLNMDSQSNNKDKNEYWLLNLGEESQIPE